MANEEDEEVKLILLGESGVGKTAIIKRYLYDEFSSIRTPSDSMHYVEKDLTINKRKIKLNVWDTIGQEKYRSLSKLFLNGTHIVILVYSIDDHKSFEELNYWNKLYREQLGDDILLGVVGNKIDLYENQTVTEKEGKEFAEKHNGFFAQLSAKQSKINIDEYMTKMVTEYLNKKYNKINVKDFEIVQERQKGIILDNKQLEDMGKKDDGCCGGKEKARKKKYEEIHKNNKGCIDIIFLGEKGVGKTSLIKRLDNKEFDQNEKHTNDADTYNIEYINTSTSMKFTLNINDINNDDKKAEKTENRIKNCQIYFLVYDLNNPKTFEEVEFYVQVIKSFKKKEKEKNFVIAIIGNKKDLKGNEKNKDNKPAEDNNNENLVEKGKKLANEINGIFYTTSAKEIKDIKHVIGLAVENYINKN